MPGKPPAFKLFYHPSKDDAKIPGRGTAEKIRLLLAETGLKYTDVALDDGAFQAMVKDNKIVCGQLPVLQQDADEFYEMSTAIMEHIATVADSLGLGQGGNKYMGLPTEYTKVRAIGQLAGEFANTLKPWAKGTPEAPADPDGVINKYFGLFQGILKLNDDDDVRTDEYSYGKQLTWADIALFEVTNACLEAYGISKIRPFVKLKEFHDKVAARSRIAMRLSTRPQRVA